MRLPILVASLTALLFPSCIVRAEVRLAVAGPMTGASAPFGAQMRNGVAQAVEDINKAGGILGERIVLSVGDDIADPRQGVTVANRLAAQDVRYVVGHFNSGVTIPAARVYADHGILLITPSAISPQVTDKGRWNVFRACGREDQQSRVAGAYLVARYKDKKIAFLHDKTPYGRGLADQVRTYVNAHGLSEVLYDSIDPAEKDHAAIIARIAASGADLVYWGGLSTEAGLLIRQMRDAGLQTVLMGGDGIVTDELATIAGPGVVGTLMTFPADPRQQSEAADVVKEFRDRTIDPEAYTLYSYAAVQLIEQAAKKAGTLAPPKVAEVLHSGTTFKTVIGDIAFDSKGDRLQPDYVVYVWRREPDGRLDYVRQ